MVFGTDDLSVDGRTLDPACRDQEDPHRLPNELLRRHFRQSVLANMGGVFESIFEHDFPLGTHMVRDCRRAMSEREVELNCRLD